MPRNDYIIKCKLLKRAQPKIGTIELVCNPVKRIPEFFFPCQVLSPSIKPPFRGFDFLDQFEETFSLAVCSIITKPWTKLFTPLRWTNGLPE